ncbi:MAG: hypothetical protein SGPRY_006983 [Prymnesium sp.]
MPFTVYDLETKMEKKEDKQGVDKIISKAGLDFGPKQRSAGLLKMRVYNGNRVEDIRTTREMNVGTTLEPEFYAAFELTAVLPGQSRLHIEVWDYQVLSETQIGGTTIDLEDRLFSRKWLKMHEEAKLPRETRLLAKPADQSPQGAITLKARNISTSHPTHRCERLRPRTLSSPPLPRAIISSR